MAGRFTWLIRETLTHPRACVRYAQPPAGDRARRRILREGGQTMAEYAIILALVAVIASAAFAGFGTALAAQIEAVSEAF